MTFNKEKFLEAYRKDPEALKSLLVGTKDSPGIFARVENTVNTALASVTGYFAAAESSYTKEINNYTKKIKRANEEVARYKARLEAKFQSMDLLISNMKNQYNSFLSV